MESERGNRPYLEGEEASKSIKAKMRAAAKKGSFLGPKRPKPAPIIGADGTIRIIKSIQDARDLEDEINEFVRDGDRVGQ